MIYKIDKQLILESQYSTNPYYRPENDATIHPKSNPYYKRENDATIHPKSNPYYKRENDATIYPKSNPYYKRENDATIYPKSNPYYKPENDFANHNIHESAELNAALSQVGDEMEDDATSKISNNIGKIAAVTGVLGVGAVAAKNMAVNRSNNDAKDIHKNMNSYNQRRTQVKNSTTSFGH